MTILVFFFFYTVTEKNATKNILDGRKDRRKDGRTEGRTDGRTEVKQYTPLLKGMLIY
jgi:hypothetical protein